MIAAKNRFHGHGSLRYVYQHGRTVRGPLCALKYVRNKRRENYRLAVVVSKKVSKKAVVRNRIRRRVYETFRSYESGIDQAYDIVITVFHEQIKDIPARELNQIIYTQLKQASILGEAGDSKK